MALLSVLFCALDVVAMYELTVFEIFFLISKLASVEGIIWTVQLWKITFSASVFSKLLN